MARRFAKPPNAVTFVRFVASISVCHAVLSSAYAQSTAKELFVGLDGGTTQLASATPGPAKPVKPKVLGLQTTIYQLFEDGGTKAVSPSTVFAGGNRIRLGFNANRAGYLYIVNLGSSGQVATIFPNSAMDNNQVQPGLVYQVPQQTGKSSFQIVLDSLLGRLSHLRLIVQLHDQVSKILVSVLVHSREIPMDHLTSHLVKTQWHPIVVVISMPPLVIRHSKIIQKEPIILPSVQEHSNSIQQVSKIRLLVRMRLEIIPSEIIMLHSENIQCDSLNHEVTILPSVKIIFGISMLVHTISLSVMRMNSLLVLEISLSVTLSFFLMVQ